LGLNLIDPPPNPANLETVSDLIERVLL